MQEEIDSLSGRIAALSMTLTAVIQQLPRIHGARAAVELKMAHELTRKDDQEYETPEGEIRARDAIVEGYLQMLSAVATHGE